MTTDLDDMTLAERQLLVFGMLGSWAADDQRADEKVREQEATFEQTVARLTPTALEAITNVVVGEWRKRYGNDEAVGYAHRMAKRKEVRP